MKILLFLIIGLLVKSSVLLWGFHHLIGTEMTLRNLAVVMIVFTVITSKVTMKV